MIKTKTIETVEEYDENGKLVKKTTTETEETDDNPARYMHTSSPFVYPIPPIPGSGATGFRYNPGPSSFCSEDKA